MVAKNMILILMLAVGFIFMILLFVGILALGGKLSKFDMSSGVSPQSLCASKGMKYVSSHIMGMDTGGIQKVTCYNPSTGETKDVVGPTFSKYKDGSKVK